MSARNRPFIIPDRIAGVEVEPQGDPLEAHGGRWITLVPVDEGDARIWEFDELTGRLVETR